MNVMVIVDVPVFIKTANCSMEMGNFPFGFHVQVNRVFAVCQIGLAGTDFPVLAANHLFVELFGELVPELFPVLNVIESGMLRRWTQLYSDYGILYRPILGKGQLHGVPYSHSVQIRGQQIVQYPIYFFRMLLVF